MIYCNFVVSVLGTEYSIIVKSDDEDDKFTTCDGYCDIMQKRIVISRDSKLLSHTLKHELVHAFLFESGLWDNSNPVNNWADNEEMVDWFAFQSAKIEKAYNEVSTKLLVEFGVI